MAFPYAVADFGQSALRLNKEQAEKLWTAKIARLAEVEITDVVGAVYMVEPKQCLHLRWETEESFRAGWRVFFEEEKIKREIEKEILGAGDDPEDGEEWKANR